MRKLYVDGQVVWTQGSTQGGSSGSPLIDADTKRVVGVLTGGVSSCETRGQPDYFGRLSRVRPQSHFLQAPKACVKTICNKASAVLWHVLQALYTNLGFADSEDVLFGCCAELKVAASMHPHAEELIAGASAARGIMIESLDLPDTVLSAAGVGQWPEEILVQSAGLHSTEQAGSAAPGCKPEAAEFLPGHRLLRWREEAGDGPCGQLLPHRQHLLQSHSQIQRHCLVSTQALATP